MITLERIMEYASTLAPLPQTACRLAAMVADDRSTIDQIAEVIEFDQVLTVEVLRFANSVASASQRKIDTVRTAVIRMGAARILERLIAGHVQQTMRQPIVGYGFQGDELWRHSVAAAVVAESLGSYTGTQIAGISFTASLLHDIGKLVIGRCIGDEELRSVLAAVNSERKEAFETVEKQLLGYSHAQIGAQICATWNLPERIVIAIRNHHLVDEADDPVTDCVRLSNLTAKLIGEGIGHEGMALVIDTTCARRFGFSKESFEAFCANASYRFNEVIATYR
ncbi:MAG: HDOD domain-containing protein [Chitinispirillaceae bacterium]|nr:HDOD domain-containing protein [Chitinispirillaceae bacterium]